MNCHKLIKVNLKNNSRQCIHTFYFGAELGCVLKIAVLRKKALKSRF